MGFMVQATGYGDSNELRDSLRDLPSSPHDGLGVAEKAPVWGAARTGRQPFMRERQGNVPLTGAHGCLGEGPVHDAALRVAAADLP